MKKEILEKTAIKWNNIYYECEDYILLNISKAETNESYDVFIDKDDFKLVSKGQWFVRIARKDTYLKNIASVIWTKHEKGKSVNYQLHQLILNTKHKDIIVDHINMNRFDNRRENIRISNRSENATNQMHKGYYFDKVNEKYLVRIRINGKCINIGRYNTEEEAEEMYLKSCLLIHKEDISYYVKERVEKSNVILSGDDYNNKYIKKLLNIINNKQPDIELNGSCNSEYIKNMDLIISLVGNGKSWHYIAKYLVSNKLMKKASGETLQKYYNNYKDKLKLNKI